MAKSSGESITHLLTSIFLLAGLYDIFMNFEDNKCEMTYMYELPEFAQVSLNHSRYSLYVYGEGKYFQSVKGYNLQGIPVLFIPGHGGSYKQARSIGSVLLQKSLENNDRIHFNVFTVDLNKELVALYGGTLNDQADFVQRSIEKILSLYDNADGPKSVVLMGHSMGGLIARAQFLQEGFDTSSITTIINLATPNIGPVLHMDSDISSFYRKVNDYWKKNANTTLQSVSVVSIGGGSRDFHVPTAYTKLPINSTNVISTVTTSIPRVHVSTDHQCIVWCKQLVLVTARFLFDIIDSQTAQITDDVSIRTRAMDFHFRHNSGVDKFSSSVGLRTVKISPAYQWLLVDSPLWSISDEEIGTGAYFVFQINTFTDVGANNFVARIDTPREKWIFVCKSSNDVTCTHAMDFSPQAISTPNYRLIHLDLYSLQNEGYTHVIFPVSLSRGITLLDVNILSDQDISTEVIVPHVFSNLWTFNKGYENSVQKYPEEFRFYHKVKLESFQSIYQAFKLNFSPDTLVRSEIEWDQAQNSFGIGSIRLKLNNIPQNLSDKVYVHVYTETAESEVGFKLKVEFQQLLGQIVRYYGTSLPIYIISNIVLVYIYQVNQILLKQPCHTVNDAREVTAKPFKVQPFLSLIKVFFGFEAFVTVWNLIGFPIPDSIIIENEHRTWFAFGPLVAFLFAYEILTLMLLVQSTIMFLIKPVILSVVKFKSLKPFHESSVNRSLFHASMISVIIQAGSAYGLLYMYCASFVHSCLLNYGIVHLSPQEITEWKDKRAKELAEAGKKKDTVESVKPAENDGKENEKEEKRAEETPAPAKPESKDPEPTSTSQDLFSVYFVLSQLWLWLFLFSIPSFGVGLVNFGSSGLPRDPVMLSTNIAAVLFILQSLCTSHDGILNSKLKVLSWFKFPLSVLMAFFCIYNIHRVQWFILAFLSFHTITQLY